MHAREDYEQPSPIVVSTPVTATNIFTSIARAIVSLTLLAVLLLAFGAALAGWFLRRDLQEDLRREIETTSAYDQLIVEYRNELEARRAEMRAERSILRPPQRSELYEDMMTRRQGLGGGAQWRSQYDLQADIDELSRDNATLRNANQAMRNAGNPTLPRENRQP